MRCIENKFQCFFPFFSADVAGITSSDDGTLVDSLTLYDLDEVPYMVKEFMPTGNEELLEALKSLR
jgi:hypothetical protein